MLTAWDVVSLEMVCKLPGHDDATRIIGSENIDMSNHLRNLVAARQAARLRGSSLADGAVHVSTTSRRF